MVITTQRMPCNVETIHLRIKYYYYVARFKNHFAYVVGRVAHESTYVSATITTSRNDAMDFFSMLLGHACYGKPPAHATWPHRQQLSKMKQLANKMVAWYFFVFSPGGIHGWGTTFGTKDLRTMLQWILAFIMIYYNLINKLKYISR